MPVYEYVCTGCRRRFSALVGVVAQPRPVACPKCGSGESRRLVSRFSRLRSEDDMMDALADSADLAGLDEEDPASVARWMRKMGSEMGEDLGDDFEEAMEAEAGGIPDGEGTETGDGSPLP